MTEQTPQSGAGGRTALLGLVLIGVLLLAIVILLNLRQTLLNAPQPTGPSRQILRTSRRLSRVWNYKTSRCTVTQATT